MRRTESLISFAGYRALVPGAAVVVILLGASTLPNWLLFPLAVALANGIAAGGVVVLMRTGNVTFGQALPYCVGAYGAWFIPSVIGLNDAVMTIACAGLAGMLLNALLGVFLVRFSGIFFAMLSLALSMMFYGLLVKNQVLGGTDGLSVPPPTFLSLRVDGERLLMASYFVVVGMVALVMVATKRLQRSWIGLGMSAAGRNDIRVEYLGGNVRVINWLAFCYCGLLGGIGGALIGILSGHAAPELAYWSKSGELVLIAVLGNSANVLMVFVASILIEMIRMFASISFPYTWQAVLGVTLLAIILFFPDGLDVLGRRYNGRRDPVHGGSVDVRT